MSREGAIVIRNMDLIRLYKEKTVNFVSKLHNINN